MPQRSGPLMPVAVATVAASAVTGLLAVLLVAQPRDAGATRSAPDIVIDPAASDPSDPSTPPRDGFRVWAVDPDGRTVRWDPCEPIPLVVDPTGAPAGALEDLTRAIDLLVLAGGPRLVVEGATTERPAVRRRPYQPERYGERWAPVLVAWAAPGDTDLPLAASDRGLALPVAVRADGRRAFVTGQVVLNAARDDLVGGFEDRATSWGATLVHELGHLVGLGHVEDLGELMSRRPGRGPVRLGPGDRAGLAHLADDGRCAPAPRPRALPVERPDGDAPAGVSPGR
ncbi:MAG: hypothetical protein RLZZ272_577 [Actinomycetota bacterium]